MKDRNADRKSVGVSENASAASVFKSKTRIIANPDFTAVGGDPEVIKK